MPVPASQLLKRFPGAVGLGDNVVVCRFFTQNLAVALSGNYVDALLIDVLASQLFAAVLVGSHLGHDASGGDGLSGGSTTYRRPRE